MPDLHELCAAAVEAATGDEAVEAYAEESRHTEASALRGEVEGLDVRRIARRRRSVDRRTAGSATRTRPTPRPTRCATTVRARPGERRARRARRVQRCFRRRGAVEPIPALFREDAGRHPHRPQGRAGARPGATGDLRSDPRATKVDAAQIGDAVSRVAIASTQRRAGRVRADRRLVRGGRARRGGRRDPDGILVPHRPRRRRAGVGGVADEAVERAVRMLGAAKPPTAQVPIVLDQFAAMSFLGVLAGALSAEAVLKGRSLFAPMVGRAGGLRSCSRWSTTARHDGPAACAVRRRGRADGPDRAVHRRNAERVPAQHVHGRAHGRRNALHRQRERGGTGSARRGDHELLPGAGRAAFDELLARAEGGVLIQDVSGVHSRSEPDQRRVLRGRDGPADLPAGRWASRCAR